MMRKKAAMAAMVSASDLPVISWARFLIPSQVSSLPRLTSSTMRVAMVMFLSADAMGLREPPRRREGRRQGVVWCSHQVTWEV